MNSPQSADLRAIGLFLLGISVGICLMVLYSSWRGNELPPVLTSPNSAEVD